eukprot:CAMPEP_0172614724 /NCGR_PEP_ID=MMETSP1068-20121228/54610_1 /TAXON_ID=35684 /ORGANISM="Pseudopedinella elastica, Strain CCMP716" /LENGTH=137 /DNA_ID=CAMNT_0013419617 /DNA_START=404 /DNA_END=816 /DNA_ORIENTATION=+
MAVFVASPTALPSLSFTSYFFAADATSPANIFPARPIPLATSSDPVFVLVLGNEAHRRADQKGGADVPRVEKLDARNPRDNSADSRRCDGLPLRRQSVLLLVLEAIYRSLAFDLAFLGFPERVKGVRYSDFPPCYIL